MTVLSDVVSQCLAGNTRAFETIIDMYQRKVFDVALRMLNDQGEAERITQSVFIKAYQNLCTLNEEKELLRW